MIPITIYPPSQLKNGHLGESFIDDFRCPQPSHEVPSSTSSLKSHFESQSRYPAHAQFSSPTVKLSVDIETYKRISIKSNNRFQLGDPVLIWRQPSQGKVGLLELLLLTYHLAHSAEVSPVTGLQQVLGLCGGLGVDQLDLNSIVQTMCSSPPAPTKPSTTMQVLQDSRTKLSPQLLLPCILDLDLRRTPPVVPRTDEEGGGDASTTSMAAELSPCSLHHYQSNRVQFGDYWLLPIPSKQVPIVRELYYLALPPMRQSLLQVCQHYMPSTSPIAPLPHHDDHHNAHNTALIDSIDTIDTSVVNACTKTPPTESPSAEIVPPLALQDTLPVLACKSLPSAAGTAALHTQPVLGPAPMPTIPAAVKAQWMSSNTTIEHPTPFIGAFSLAALPAHLLTGIGVHGGISQIEPAITAVPPSSHEDGLDVPLQHHQSKPRNKSEKEPQLPPPDQRAGIDGLSATSGSSATLARYDKELNLRLDPLLAGTSRSTVATAAVSDAVVLDTPLKTPTKAIIAAVTSPSILLNGHGRRILRLCETARNLSGLRDGTDAHTMTPPQTRTHAQAQTLSEAPPDLQPLYAMLATLDTQAIVACLAHYDLIQLTLHRMHSTETRFTPLPALDPHAFATGRPHIMTTLHNLAIVFQQQCAIQAEIVAQILRIARIWVDTSYHGVLDSLTQMYESYGLPWHPQRASGLQNVPHPAHSVPQLHKAPLPLGLPKYHPLVLVKAPVVQTPGMTPMSLEVAHHPQVHRLFTAPQNAPIHFHLVEDKSRFLTEMYITALSRRYKAPIGVITMDHLRSLLYHKQNYTTREQLYPFFSTTIGSEPHSTIKPSFGLSNQYNIAKALDDLFTTIQRAFPTFILVLVDAHHLAPASNSADQDKAITHALQRVRESYTRQAQQQSLTSPQPSTPPRSLLVIATTPVPSQLHSTFLQQFDSVATLSMGMVVPSSDHLYTFVDHQLYAMTSMRLADFEPEHGDRDAVMQISSLSSSSQQQEAHSPHPPETTSAASVKMLLFALQGLSPAQIQHILSYGISAWSTATATHLSVPHLSQLDAEPRVNQPSLLQYLYIAARQTAGKSRGDKAQGDVSDAPVPSTSSATARGSHQQLGVGMQPPTRAAHGPAVLLASLPDGSRISYHHLYAEKSHILQFNGCVPGQEWVLHLPPRVLSVCVNQLTSHMHQIRYLQRLLKPSQQAAPSLHYVSSGLLLTGPVGCGKTFLPRVLSQAIGLPLLTVSPVDIISSSFGQSEKSLRKKFAEAQQKAPCILFFDDIHTLIPPPSLQSQSRARKQNSLQTRPSGRNMDTDADGDDQSHDNDSDSDTDTDQHNNGLGDDDSMPSMLKNELLRLLEERHQQLQYSGNAISPIYVIATCPTIKHISTEFLSKNRLETVVSLSPKDLIPRDIGVIKQCVMIIQSLSQMLSGYSKVFCPATLPTWGAMDELENVEITPLQRSFLQKIAFFTPGQLKSLTYTAVSLSQRRRAFHSLTHVHGRSWNHKSEMRLASQGGSVDLLDIAFDQTCTPPNTSDDCLAKTPVIRANSHTLDDPSHGSDNIVSERVELPNQDSISLNDFIDALNAMLG